MDEQVLILDPHRQKLPIAKMKLGAYYGDRAFFNLDGQKPDKILITTLYTWEWAKVANAIQECRMLYSDKIPIECGGIYATLLPDHCRSIGADIVHVGRVEKYDVQIPGIVKTTQGCPRGCEFCASELVDGKFKVLKKSIKDELTKRMVIWDYNFLANPHHKDILWEMLDFGAKVQIEQGLDARLMDDENITMILKVHDSSKGSLRMGWDHWDQKEHIEYALSFFPDHWRKKTTIFMIYNWKEDYLTLMAKLRFCRKWGVRVCAEPFHELTALNFFEGYKFGWTAKEFKHFRYSARRHNQKITWGYDHEDIRKRRIELSKEGQMVL